MVVLEQRSEITTTLEAVATQSESTPAGDFHMGVGIALGRLTFLQKPRTQLLGKRIVLDEDRGFPVSKNLS